CDWASGRILAVHFIPSGASYQATFETLVSGKPLNVTDVEFGPDGAMYFITGGRGTKSALYRVRQNPTDKEDNRISPGLQNQAAAARGLRRRLESIHGKNDPAQLEFIWSCLDSNDRWI